MKEKIKKINELFDKAMKVGIGWNNIEKGELNISKEKIIKNREKAIICLDKILEIDPKNLNGLRGKGFFLSLNGKFGQAEYYYDEVLKINPKDYPSLLEKAQLLKHTGRYELAIDYLEKALEVAPENDSKTICLMNKCVCLQETMNRSHLSDKERDKIWEKWHETDKEIKKPNLHRKIRK